MLPICLYTRQSLCISILNVTDIGLGSIYCWILRSRKICSRLPEIFHLLPFLLHSSGQVHIMPSSGSCSRGNDIATYYCWRPGQGLLVLQGQGVTSLRFLMTLELAFFPQLVQSGPYKQILSNHINIGDMMDRKKLIYTENTFHIFNCFLCFTI